MSLTPSDAVFTLPFLTFTYFPTPPHFCPQILKNVLIVNFDSISRGIYTAIISLLNRNKFFSIDTQLTTLPTQHNTTPNKMTQLQVAKKLLLEANARIFDLECRSAEQVNNVEDLEGEVCQLKAELAAASTSQKRKRSAEYNFPDDDAEAQQLQPQPRRKTARNVPTIHVPLRNQLADAKHQIEQQIGEIEALKQQLRREQNSCQFCESSTICQVCETSTGAARNAKSTPYSSTSRTLSSERYAPSSPSRYAPSSPSRYSSEPTSPPYVPQFPAAYYAAEMSPQQFSPRYNPPSPEITANHETLSPPWQRTSPPNEYVDPSDL